MFFKFVVVFTVIFYLLLFFFYVLCCFLFYISFSVLLLMKDGTRMLVLLSVYWVFSLFFLSYAAPEKAFERDIVLLLGVKVFDVSWICSLVRRILFLKFEFVFFSFPWPRLIWFYLCNILLCSVFYVWTYVPLSHLHFDIDAGATKRNIFCSLCIY